MTDFEIQDSIVVEEPKDATWAKVDSYAIQREGGTTSVTVNGQVRAKNWRPVIYQTGPRHHFTYRVLQQCTGPAGGDQMVAFSTTIRVGGIGGGATFLDGVGELQIRTLFAASHVEGGDGPFPLAGNVDRSPAPGTTRQIEITGTLTDEGIECRAMREDGSNELYTLIPRQKLKDFRSAEHVRVIGTIAEVSFCQQGTTIEVHSISRLPAAR